MIRIRDTRYPSTAALLSDAISVAEFYGFVPFDSHQTTKSDNKKRPNKQEVENAIEFARRDERILSSVARRIASLQHPEHEALFSWRVVEGSGPTPTATLELHISGQPSAIAEAILVVVAHAINREIGVTNSALSINSIGSGESSGRFVRDIGTYLRRHLESISPSLRPRVATDPLGTLVQLIEKGHPAVSRAPQPMEYLTEDERRRLWEFIEYLEAAKLPYELSGQILGSRDVWTHTLYEISNIHDETGEKLPIASGGRYDAIVSRFNRGPAHAAMIGVSIEQKGAMKPKVTPRQAPYIFFAHLGMEARRKALPLMEILRKENVPVRQALTFDRLAEQMALAKRLALPYVFLMGHKEAMDNAILVREVATNSQDEVPLDELPGYLRRHRIVPGASQRLVEAR